MTRVALVTGARRGIGAAVVRTLADDGYRVAAVLRSPGEVPGAARTLAADVTDAEQVDRLVADTCRDLGPVDVLVHCAGGFIEATSTVETTTAAWEDQVALNLTSAFLLCRAVLPGMTQRGWGRIVTIGSVVAQAPALGNAAAYVAAKAGLVGLTRQVALEVAGTGVTANVVNPGTIATEHLAEYALANATDTDDLADRIPVGRLGTSDEIAAAIRHLVSDQAGFTTGIAFNINGGACMV